MILAGIILFVVSVVANLAIDYKEILSKGKVNHKSNWPWIRKALISLPSVLLFAWELSDDTKWLWCIVFSSLMVAFYFWLHFDVILNLLRGEKWYYIGEPDKFDSATEKLERSIPLWLVWLIKIGLAYTFTHIYIEMT